MKDIFEIKGLWASRIISLGFFLFLGTHFSFGQYKVESQIPKNLQSARLAIIKYNQDEWPSRYIDSTHDQWVIRRYGRDHFFKNYQKVLEVSIKSFKKHKINFQVISSGDDHSRYDYLFDYRQVIVDNHESIVADKHLGGFYFFDVKAARKYAPIGENESYVRKTLRKGL